MTTIGVGGAWVGNELRVLRRAGIPFVVHSLNPPADVFYAAEDIAAINRDTRVIYPLSKLAAAAAMVAAPFRFGPRFFGALWNALTGERESLRIRAVGLWHLAVACHWSAPLRKEEVCLIHSQWSIRRGGRSASHGTFSMASRTGSTSLRSTQWVVARRSRSDGTIPSRWKHPMRCECPRASTSGYSPLRSARPGRQPFSRSASRRTRSEPTGPCLQGVSASLPSITKRSTARPTSTAPCTGPRRGPTWRCETVRAKYPAGPEPIATALPQPFQPR